MVLKKFKEKTGLDWEIFQDDELFEKEFPEKNNEEILQIRQFLQSEKNKILKAEQTKKNNDFISAYVKNKDNISFVNSYVPSIYLFATKEDIMNYIQLDEVQSICYDNPNNQLIS
ncbi:MAG: hypothetical protein IKV01_01265 [Clostridia bacterium]|nr:hypothetical protein [Clostridia bacterium]